MSAEQIIVPQDHTQPTMKVSVFDGKVVQHFPHALEYIALEAEIALQLGMVLIDRAYEARGDLKPADGAVKHELVERHRKTLMRRYEIVLNSTRERKKMSNHELARALLDITFAEIF